MPIKPALGRRTTRRPEPRERRWVSCPTCGRGFDVSTRAVSATCPTCTRHFVFEDVMIRRDTRRDVSTMGHVRVEAGSGMIGEVVCGTLTIAGKYDGEATVFGAALILEGGTCRGSVRARSLEVPLGTSFVGRAHIGTMLEDDPLTFSDSPPVRSERDFSALTSPVKTVVATRLRRAGVMKAG
ncbi:MAG: polymer-forming cytoskeletal protein [Phycisphaeraceae bacterium]